MKHILMIFLVLLTIYGCKEEQIDEDEKIMSYINANNIDATKTASGLYYFIETEGTGGNPELDDLVKVDYKGSLLDGSVFESTYASGQPAQFVLGNLILGWQEGIQLMKKGGKSILIIPSNLAYGNQQVGVISPNSPLVFEIELLDF